MSSFASPSALVPLEAGNVAVRAWHALVGAARVSNVRCGFYGTLLIALGSLSPAYLPYSSPWLAPLRSIHFTGTPAKIIGTVLVLAGLGLLVDAWFKLRPISGTNQAAVVYHQLRHWAVLAIWSLPFLAAPPIFSHDAYSYAAQGWLLHNGIDPYHAGPGVLPGPFADQVAWVWRYTPTPYGPLALKLDQFIVWATGFDPYLSAVLQRVPALLGVISIVYLVPRIARQMGVDPAPVAWFAALNPVLIVDFVGGCHNDSLMMGFVVLGLWLAGRRGWWWVLAAAVIGVGAAIKQPAFLAAYAIPLIPRPWESWRWKELGITVARVLTAFAVSIGVFAGISIASGLGFGWYNAVNVPGMVVTVSPTTVIGQVLQYLLNLTGLDPTGHAAITALRSIGLVLAGAVITLLAFTVARRRPITFLCYGYLAVAFLGPALHSWYVLWGGLLLPLSRPRSRAFKIAVWTTIILLSYGAINLAWRNGFVALGVAALMGYLWMVRSHEIGNEARLALRRRHPAGKELRRREEAARAASGDSPFVEETDE